MYKLNRLVVLLPCCLSCILLWRSFDLFPCQCFAVSSCLGTLFGVLIHFIVSSFKDDVWECEHYQNVTPIYPRIAQISAVTHLVHFLLKYFDLFLVFVANVIGLGCISLLSWWLFKMSHLMNKVPHVRNLCLSLGCAVSKNRVRVVCSI